MPFSPSPNKRPSTPRQNYFALLCLLVVLILLGPLFIFQAIHADHRDRPSLQWPKVSGKTMQCEQGYVGGKHSHYYVTDTYTYIVDGRRYVQHRIALWNENLSGDGQRTSAFVATHPVPSSVDVYYDPQNPANAVLIPGPDEAGNRTSMRCGIIVLICGIFLIFTTRPKLAEYKAQMQFEKTKPSPTKRPKTSLPECYACYTPGSKLKITICPDKDEVSDMLGTDDGQPMCDWKPEDRMIDTAGREYRLVKQPGKGGYDLDPTGETWTYDRLLNLAETNRRMPKSDPNFLRHNLQSAPENERMAIVMKSISELPTHANLYIAGFLLFLLLFFIAVVYVAGKFFIWLSNR